MNKLLVQDMKDILNKLRLLYSESIRYFKMINNKQEKEELRSKIMKIYKTYNEVLAEYNTYLNAYKKLLSLMGTKNFDVYQTKFNAYENQLYSKYHYDTEEKKNNYLKTLLGVGIASLGAFGFFSVGGIDASSAVTYVEEAQIPVVEEVQPPVESVKDVVMETKSNQKIIIDSSPINTHSYQDTLSSIRNNGVSFNTETMIYVTPGAESDYKGVPYPLEQYVEGVLTGEHVAQTYYRLYTQGEITEDEMMEGLKAFAIIARSYGLYQTVYSSKHYDDHKINSTSGKQCFTSEHLDSNEPFALYARTAVQETLGMTLTVDNLPLNARYDSFTSGGDMENGYYVGYYTILDRTGRDIGKQKVYVPENWVDIHSKLRQSHACGASQYGIIALAHEGMNYKDIARHFYTDESTIKQFNYGAETFSKLSDEVYI